MVRKSAKTDGQNGQKQTAPQSAKTSEKVQKLSKTSENRPKGANVIGALYVDRLRAMLQWPYSGGHLDFPSQKVQERGSSVNSWGGEIVLSPLFWGMDALKLAPIKSRNAPNRRS